MLILEEIQENSLNELIGDLIYLIEDMQGFYMKPEFFIVHFTKEVSFTFFHNLYGIIF